jgi:signal transduction histidine kinase
MNQIRVLLIEDNDADAALVAEALKSQENYIIERAATLKDAKGKLRDKAFAIVLLELNLPDSKGIDTFIALRSSFPEIPIVVLSALNDNQLAYDVVRRGAQDYLVKGIVSGDSVLRCLKYAIERKRLETAAQRVAREIFLHAPGSIVRFDQDLRVIETNAAFLANFAVPADQVKGKRLFELFPSIPEKELLDSLDQGYSYAIAEQSLEYLDSVSSKLKIANIAVWPIISEQDEFTGAILMLEDITDRFELSKQRDAVMAIIAHDLKNPLLGSQRIYELLLNNKFGTVPEHQLDAINTLSRANDNCLHILKNLLHLFSYTRGEEVLLFKELELLPTVESCIKEWLPVAKLNQQKLVCHLRNGYLPPVLADIQAISYLLNNLISNALKYSPPGSQIEIRAESDHERVKLFVADNGPGIPHEVEQELFKPFGRGKIGNLQSASSGLGLFLCNQIMRTHQGSIRYVPNKPTGAVFMLDFPIYQHVAQVVTV